MSRIVNGITEYVVQFSSVQFSSVQFKMVPARSEKPVCAPTRLSEVSPTLPLTETVPMLKQYVCLWTRDYSLLRSHCGLIPFNPVRTLGWRRTISHLLCWCNGANLTPPHPIPPIHPPNLSGKKLSELF